MRISIPGHLYVCRPILTGDSACRLTEKWQSGVDYVVSPLIAHAYLHVVKY